MVKLKQLSLISFISYLNYADFDYNFHSLTFYRSVLLSRRSLRALGFFLGESWLVVQDDDILVNKKIIVPYEVIVVLLKLSNPKFIWFELETHDEEEEKSTDSFMVLSILSYVSAVSRLRLNVSHMGNVRRWTLFYVHSTLRELHCEAEYLLTPYLNNLNLDSYHCMDKQSLGKISANAIMKLKTKHLRIDYPHVFPEEMDYKQEYVTSFEFRICLTSKLKEMFQTLSDYFPNLEKIGEKTDEKDNLIEIQTVISLAAFLIQFRDLNQFLKDMKFSLKDIKMNMEIDQDEDQKIDRFEAVVKKIAKENEEITYEVDSMDKTVTIKVRFPQISMDIFLKPHTIYFK